MTADHFAPLTWPRCVTDGCTQRVDPWEHTTRCAAHRRTEQVTAELARMRQVRDTERARARTVRS